MHHINPIRTTANLGPQRTASNRSVGRYTDFMSEEQFRSVYDGCSSAAEKTLKESERLRVRSEYLDKRCAKKMKAAVENAVDILRARGEEIPERLLNLLKSSK